MLAEGFGRNANRYAQTKVQVCAVYGDGHDIKLGTCRNQASANFQPFIERCITRCRFQRRQDRRFRRHAGGRFIGYAGRQGCGAHFGALGKALHSISIESDGEPATIALRPGGFLFDHNGTHHAIKLCIGGASRRIHHALNAIPGAASPSGEGAFLRHYAILSGRFRHHTALRERTHVTELCQGGQGGQAKQ